MSATPGDARQSLVATWMVGIVGTIVIGVAVYYFFKHAGSPFAAQLEWAKWASHAVLLGALPAIMYLRKFKPRLDAYESSLRTRGQPDPALRALVLRSLAIGGALCELPMAMGVVHLLLGGETRWFVGATLITIVLRLSYRPFTRKG